MRDPLLIDRWETKITDDQREQYQTVNEKWDLVDSLNQAHDRIRTLTETNNQLAASLIEAHKKQERCDQKLWIMSLIVSPIVAAVLKSLWSKIFP